MKPVIMSTDKQNTNSVTIDPTRLPAHVAIIMDGNGRWAQAHGMERSAGHAEGVNTVRRITEEASRIGIKYLTLYTFSTENWNRPKAEVDALMHLIVIAIERETPDLIKNNVRLTSIGDIDRMPKEAADRLRKCMDDTSHCTGLTLVLALSYSARAEMVQAVRKLAAKHAAGELRLEDISEETISDALTTSKMPDPDLIIRTGGDMRLSNFLLYQAAYTELAVCSTYWPDYSIVDFQRHIAEYQHRQRRFGKTGEQIESEKN